ncbi:maleylacetate reductase [Celeribacter neptunius]|uniref:Alcohol dehydrogenase, class IV n=1 Tax=Celeribacter neptunius TaxID=588602 RepID=A0A1I3R1T5_9RHOB|nr:maleylacetate reductase [Celeribacter neptunius]SFJ40474.1 Alcohol dehydrogenase, class IV [Celeribacter neptunius]
MHSFTYTANPGRILFGFGKLEALGEEIRAAGMTRVLLLSTPQQVDQVQALSDTLGDLSAGVFSDARMHTPAEVTEQALKYLKSVGADGIVSLGGGSTIGLGKALALRTNLGQIVIPTTYAGSEMTPILGETADGVKRTLRSEKVLPETVIYDVDLTMTLPAAMSGLSGMNAVAHAIEALYCREANPVTSLIAAEGVRALTEALPRIAKDPADRAARSDALYGAWLCGTCLGTVGMALHHKLCHALGGAFDLPHAATHTIVLPHALAYTAPAIPEVMARLRETLNTDDPARRLYEIGCEIGAPEGLKALEMPEEGIARVVDLSLENPYWNPRPLDREGLTLLLEDAFHGRPPSQH